MKRKSFITLIPILGIALLFVAGGTSLEAQSKQEEKALQKFIEIHEDMGKGGWLGVKIAEYSIEKGGEESREGVKIVEVFEDSAASRAGLREGDIIVKIDGKAVDGVQEVVEEIRANEPGEKIKIIILRNGKEKKRYAVLGERPEDMDVAEHKIIIKGGDPEQFVWMAKQLHGKPRLGVELTELNDQLREYFKVEKGLGVLVRRVIEDTPAEKAGLKAGDVILSINGEEVKSSSDLIEALADIEKDDVALIELARDGAIMNFSIGVGPR